MHKECIVRHSFTSHIWSGLSEMWIHYTTWINFNCALDSNKRKKETFMFYSDKGMWHKKSLTWNSEAKHSKHFCISQTLMHICSLSLLETNHSWKTWTFKANFSSTLLTLWCHCHIVIRRAWPQTSRPFLMNATASS